MTRHILLCRHGPHHDGQLTRVKASDGGMEYLTDAVGERLRDQVETSGPGRIQLRSIWCADTVEAKATLRRLATTLRLTIDPGLTCGSDPSSRTIPIKVKRALEPRNAFRPCTVATLAASLAKVPLACQGNAVLVVGHQPQLSWIADELLRTHRRYRWQRHPPVPIDRAGLVCITLDSGSRRRARLSWAISFDDRAVADQVRDKIRLKMETAKLLSGALTLGLTVIFGVLFDKSQFDGLGERRWVVQVAAALLLAAAVLYFATMYAYDRLLMPERFWGERRPPRQRLRQAGGPRQRRRFTRSRNWLVDRPPSSAAWVLYQNMMRVWRNMFTGASMLVALGIGLLGYGALRLRPVVALGIGIPAALVIGVWTWWSRPVLGSED